LRRSFDWLRPANFLLSEAQWISPESSHSGRKAALLTIIVVTNLERLSTKGKMASAAPAGDTNEGHDRRCLERRYRARIGG